ncbi:hypothetical protein CRI69_24940 [Escherichia sp. E4742]|nr:hypothetical protein CRI69_24940 [Escherichia sp. E4742]
MFFFGYNHITNSLNASDIQLTAPSHYSDSHYTQHFILKNTKTAIFLTAKNNQVRIKNCK